MKLPSHHASHVAPTDVVASLPVATSTESESDALSGCRINADSPKSVNTERTVVSLGPSPRRSASIAATTHSPALAIEMPREGTSGSPIDAARTHCPRKTPIAARLPQWIAANGLTHLKIKLNGDDLAWDVHRVASVEQVASQAQQARGCTQWNYSLDFNERCANVQYVLDFLGRLEEQSPQALRRVQYIEQPTHRDLRAHPNNRMHAAARMAARAATI